MRYRRTAIISILFTVLIGGGPILGLNGKAAMASDPSADRHCEMETHDHHDEDAGPEDNDEELSHTETGDEHEADHVSDAEHPEAEDDGHGHGEEADIIEMTGEQQEESGLVIATARPGSIRNTLSFSGEVRLDEDRVVHIVPLVTGIIREVSVSLGENVRSGQELARVDSPDLAEMEADYLEKLRNIELARSASERKEYLWQEKIASEADRLEARAAFQNAETLLFTAKQRLMSLGLSKKQVMAISEAGYDRFGQHSISTPISGTVIARRCTRGEKTGDSELFVIADLSKVWVDLQIPAKDIRQVDEGLAVEIISAEGRREEGTISLVGPVINEESRTILGRVVLANPERYWKPGQFVTGRMRSKTVAAVVAVPSDAVQTIDGETVVFIPEGHGFRAVDVIPGRSSRKMTEILAGLEPGEQYVAEGAFFLKAIKATSGAGSHAGHGH